jgi:methionyl aminopeptidase
VIALKSAREIEIMKRANIIVAEVLRELKEKVAAGVTTLELDTIAEELTLKKNAIPAFKGYNVAGRVYPRCLCASINEEIVHGIPTNRALREGDIIGLDYGVIYEGFYGDSAVTVGVGRVSDEARRLMEVTEIALYKGIEQLHDGKRLGDLGHAVQQVAESAGYSVVRAFVGHGIGRKLHEEPPVPNYGEPDRGIRLREGMVLAIEPMLNVGGLRSRDKGRRLDGGDEGWKPGGPLRALRRRNQGRPGYSEPIINDSDCANPLCLKKTPSKSPAPCLKRSPTPCSVSRWTTGIKSSRISRARCACIT